MFYQKCRNSCSLTVHTKWITINDDSSTRNLHAAVQEKLIHDLYKLFSSPIYHDNNIIIIWRKSYSVNSKTSKTNFSSLIPFGSTGLFLKMKVQNLIKWSSSQNNPFCLQATHVCAHISSWNSKINHDTSQSDNLLQNNLFFQRTDINIHFYLVATFY